MPVVALIGLPFFRPFRWLPPASALMNPFQSDSMAASPQHPGGLPRPDGRICWLPFSPPPSLSSHGSYGHSALMSLQDPMAASTGCFPLPPSLSLRSSSGLMSFQDPMAVLRPWPLSQASLQPCSLPAQRPEDKLLRPEAHPARCLDDMLEGCNGCHPWSPQEPDLQP